jgi:hypothetical protein
MKYAWKLSKLRHLMFDTDQPIVLGGRAMAWTAATGVSAARSSRPRPRLLS